MFSDLLVNAAILIAVVSIGNQALKSSYLEKLSPMGSKVLAGITSGLLGILLMIYSVSVMDLVIIDFRNIAIILAAIIGGLLPAVISGILIGAFRIVYFGLNNPSALGFVTSVVIGIGTGLIGSLSLSTRKKWFFCTIYSMIISGGAIALLLIRSKELEYIMLVYCLGLALVSYFTMRYTEYLAKINSMFNKYKDESIKDYLTDLNNVRQFDRLIKDIFEKISDNGENMALLYIDIDYFKKVNDTYGHLEGDNVLKQLAVLLTKACRSFDVISRVGGEEFSIMLLDCGEEKAVEVAERIRKTVESKKFMLSNGNQISITISIGIAAYPKTTTSLDDIVEYADKALYEAKLSGRNKVVLYNH